MSKVDERRTFEGTLALPYEGLDTNSFDDAVWSAPLGQPQKAESQWGFHLILVKERGAGPRAIMAPAAPPVDVSELKVKAPEDAGKSM